MYINHATFFAGYRKAYGPLTQSQVDGLERLLTNLEADDALEDEPCAVAYMLATVKHECADTWRPIVERGMPAYFDKYDAGTPLGARLGNTQRGDGWAYRGRGYVQITGRANYARLSDVLMRLENDLVTRTHDLVHNPELALRPDIAYAILSVGMRAGLFTGKALSDYCTGRIADYLNARRIVNGMDQAGRIASYAETFEAILLRASDDDLVIPAPAPIPLPPFVAPPPKPPPVPRPPSFWRGWFKDSH